jgi:hypothetical protein
MNPASSHHQVNGIEASVPTTILDTIKIEVDAIQTKLSPNRTAKRPANGPEIPVPRAKNVVDRVVCTRV